MFAARQASFGQRFCMISTIEPPGSPRLEHPAVGHGFDAGPAARSSSTASRRAARRCARRASRPRCTRTSAGWVETEHELRAVLDGVGPDLLAFGPDTGHMSWAGMDVPAVLRDYADRIVGVHLKDTFAAGIARAAADGPRLPDGHPSRAGSGPSPGSARWTWPPASRRSPPASPATT